MAINKEQNKLNVPPLRFPEFHGEWEEHGLSEYLDFKNGLNPDSKRFGKGIKFISVMDILNNPVITYDCIRASVQATDAEMSSFSVEYGDILFQRSSETLEDVGRANVYIDDKVAVFGGFVIEERKKRTIILCFLDICCQVLMPAKELYLWEQVHSILILDKRDLVKFY